MRRGYPRRLAGLNKTCAVSSPAQMFGKDNPFSVADGGGRC